ncbi:MAG: hypothetical protein AAGB93_03180 [Planctomycetota bacterium]
MHLATLPRLASLAALTVAASCTSPLPRPVPSSLSIQAATTPPPAASAPAGPAADAVPDTPWARFGLSAGGVIAGVDSLTRLGVEGIGIGVDLEDAFELDTTANTLRLEGFWRFSKKRRHRLDVSWIDLSRRSNSVSDTELDLGGGIVIPVGSQVNTRLDINLIRAGYSYSIFQDDRFDLALGAGLYVAPIDFELRATGVADVDESFGVTAPLPVVGFRFQFAITPRWFLQGDSNFFFLQLGDFRGSLTNSVGAVEYRAWKHVGIGLGVDSLAIAVERNSSTRIPGVNQLGSVEFGYTGLVLYLKTVF